MSPQFRLVSNQKNLIDIPVLDTEANVAIDLGRKMNNILEIDVEDYYALVEPGVTFFDLHDYLVQDDLSKKVWLDVSRRRPPWNVEWDILKNTG